MRSSRLSLGRLALLASATVGTLAACTPSAEVRNGTYRGLYNKAYDQDFFLGVPYAQPPVGDLRFRIPQSLNLTWDAPRDATAYSPICIGYGSDTEVLGQETSEDCLTINIVRPAGTSEDGKLPVAFWLHGGGLDAGASSDPRYNLSYIVNQSVDMGTPIIAASINYRLDAWGFLYSAAIAEEGGSHLGFRDQRLALHWVQENIAAFGGDPDKVTIWGESAGARSAGAQMVAYGGRDDGLFSGAALQSGWPVWASEAGGATVEYWEPFYEAVVELAGCSNATDSLTCLRAVPVAALSNIFNGSVPVPNPGWGNIVDGDFLENSTATLIREGKIVNVPLLTGHNHDEGTSFSQPGVNTDEEFLASITDLGLSNFTAQAIAQAYPDDPAVGIPGTLDGRPDGDLAVFGAQWKRVSAYRGDIMQHGPRRLFVRSLADEAPIWVYDFNVLVSGQLPVFGATHFEEVAFVFYNTEGNGYDTAVSTNPFDGAPETFHELANVMSRAWINFFTKRDPNLSGATDVVWPQYKLDDPEYLTFDVNITNLAVAKPDTYREEAIEVILETLFSI